MSDDTSLNGRNERPAALCAARLTSEDADEASVAERRRAYMRAWRQKNREAENGRRRDRYPAVKDEANRARRERYAADPDAVLDGQRRRREADPAHHVEVKRRWYEANREAVLRRVRITRHMRAYGVSEEEAKRRLGLTREDAA